jgi:hypothetical protein
MKMNMISYTITIPFEEVMKESAAVAKMRAIFHPKGLSLGQMREGLEEFARGRKTKHAPLFAELINAFSYRDAKVVALASIVNKSRSELTFVTDKGQMPSENTELYITLCLNTKPRKPEFTTYYNREYTLLHDPYPNENYKQHISPFRIFTHDTVETKEPLGLLGGQHRITKKFFYSEVGELELEIGHDFADREAFDRAKPQSKKDERVREILRQNPKSKVIKLEKGEQRDYNAFVTAVGNSHNLSKSVKELDSSELFQVYEQFLSWHKSITVNKCISLSKAVGKSQILPLMYTYLKLEKGTDGENFLTSVVKGEEQAVTDKMTILCMRSKRGSKGKNGKATKPEHTGWSTIYTEIKRDEALKYMLNCVP